MTENEKEAIEDLKNSIKYAKNCCREDTYVNQETIYIILNLVQKQQEEIEKKDKTIKNAITEIESLRTYFSEDLQPDFIRILENIKRK